MIPSGRSGNLRLLHALLAVPVFVLGAIENWYGRFDYSTDAIGYLDISRAIFKGDWRMTFNPQWSLGYPLLISLIRPIFQHSAVGEWAAIHVLNFLIFIATYLIFLFFLRTLTRGDGGTPEQYSQSSRRFYLIAGVCLFVSTEICIDLVSRVSPDMLVTAFFLLALSLSIRLVRQPAMHRGALLGLVLGAGYITKAIFMPLALAILALTGYAIFKQRKNRQPLLVALAVFVVIALPLVAALSRSLGRVTFGESGALNYAFYINLLPHWTNWQGSPGFGTPIHPSRQLLDQPPIFEFGTPFDNTYPPFGNMAYWYEGYHHFVKPRNQVVGFLRNLRYLLQALLAQPFFYMWIVALFCLAIELKDRESWFVQLRRGWIPLLMALLGIALYVQVHLEIRYLASFVAVLALLPLVSVRDPAQQLTASWRGILLSALALGAVANLAYVDRETWSRARHHEVYQQSEPWRLGYALQQLGLKPGDTVAAVGGPNAACTWAYIDGLRIVAEVGGEPYDQQHPVAADHHPDAIDLFWQAPQPTRDHMIDLLRKTGAVAIIAPPKPAAVIWPGWNPVPGTRSWIYRLVPQ